MKNNKINLLIFCFIFSILIFTSKSYSQVTNIPIDSVEKGRVYNIILYGGFEIEGTVTYIDSSLIKVKADSKEYDLKKELIKTVTPADIKIMVMEGIIKKPMLDTTEECNVYLSNRTMMKDVRLMLLDDSTVTAFKGKIEKNINIKNISGIKFIGHGFWTGALIGAGINTATWLIILLTLPGGGEKDLGKAITLFLGLALTVPAGLIGGLVGAFTVTDDSYSFSGLTYEQKLLKLKYIIKKHS